MESDFSSRSRGHSAEDSGSQGWSPLLERLPHGVLLGDAGGQWLEVNSAAQRILGLGREALVGQPVASLVKRFTAEDGGGPPPWSLVPYPGSPVSGSVVGLERAAEARIWLELSWETLPAGGVLVSFSEVSDAHLQGLQLKRMSSLYAALSQVNQAIVQSTQWQALLDRVCRVLVDPGGFAMAWIGWNDPASHEVNIVSQCGDGAGYLDHLQVRSDDTPLGRGPSGTSIREGRPLILNDFLGASEASPWHARALQAGFRASATFPIRTGGQVRGCLMVYAREKDFFGELEAWLLQEAARDIGFGLEHLDLEKRRLEAEAAQRASANLMQTLVNALPDLVWLKDVEGVYLACNRRFELLFGARTEAILGRTDYDFVPRELADSFRENDRKALAAGGPSINEESVVFAGDGHREDLETIKTPLILDDGQVVGILGIGRDVTERIRAQEALRVSEERFNSAFHLMPLPLAITTLHEGRFIAVNQAFESAYGYPMAALEGHTSVGIGLWADPEDRSRAVAILEVEGRIHELVSRWRHRDGTLRWVSYSAQIVDSGGSPHLLAGALDITERKLADDRLRDALEFNEKILATQTTGAQAFQAQSGQCVVATDSLVAIVGGSREALMAQNFRNIESWQRTGLLAAAEQAIATGLDQQLEVQIRTTFQRDLWLACQFTTYFGRGQQHLLLIVSDNTARKQSEEARHLAFTAVEQSTSAIVITDTAGTIEYVNPAFAEATGYRIEEALGRNPRFLQSGVHAPAFYEHLWATLSAGRTWRGRFQNLRKDGETYWEQATISPVRDSNGTITHYVAAKDNITESLRLEQDRQRLEQQVLHAQKMESLGSLAGGVAHDMNNVLGAILVIATTSLEQVPAESRLYRALDTIAKAATRGGQMVKSLLNFARRDPVEQVVVGFNSIIQEVVQLLERTTLSRIHLELDLEPELRAILGDPSALAHTFMNLCVNAVDAMPGEGTLILRTRNDAGRVRVQVQDTGCGMPPEILQRAMDPFFTTKGQGQGTGLGLAMAYGVVKAHSGALELQSEPGQGTCVTMLFPVAQTRGPIAPAETVQKGSAAPRALDVLVVDDDEFIQGCVPELLQALGHTSRSALSGEEALAMLASGLRPDVVILDLNMPGLGGAATLPRLRALLPELPVVVATGKADQAALALAAAYPGVSILAKPFTKDEIRIALERHGSGT